MPEPTSQQPRQLSLNGFIKQYRPLIKSCRVDDWQEPFVREYSIEIDVYINGERYQTAGTKRNDLREGSGQVQKARESAVTYLDIDGWINYCRGNLTEMTERVAVQRAINAALQLAGLPRLRDTGTRREVVHILRHGLPLCGFSRALPTDWPPGHAWMDQPGFGEPVPDYVCPSCASEHDRRGHIPHR